MLARIKQQQDVDYVIVHKVDRLARSRFDDVYINLALNEAGARPGGQYLYFFCSNRHDRGKCSQRYMQAESVEQAVANHYASLNNKWTPEQLTALRSEVLQHLAESESSRQRRADQLQRRRSKLERERTKLLQAYYADAIDVSQLKVEQTRLGRQLAAVEEHLASLDTAAHQVERTLELALQLAADCHRIYRIAPPHVRRQLNQVLFERLLVDADEDNGGGDWAAAKLNALFAQLQNHIEASQNIRPRLIPGGRPGAQRTLSCRPGFE